MGGWSSKRWKCNAFESGVYAWVFVAFEGRKVLVSFLVLVQTPPAGVKFKAPLLLSILSLRSICVPLYVEAVHYLVMVAAGRYMRNPGVASWTSYERLSYSEWGLRDELAPEVAVLR